MNLAIKKSLISIPLAICLAGCSITQSSTAIGASSGAVVGAVIGKQLGGDTGMVIGLGTGAIIGGIAGFFIGSYIEERREAQRKISQDKNTTIEFENLAKDNSSNIKDKAIISDKGQFKTRSAELSNDAREFYTLLAQTYKEKDKKILIVGHTDDTGDEKFNQSLSQRRAKVVAQIFAKNGVDIKNIYYQGAGSTKPKADNSTAQGREQNRRVEIVELDNAADVSLYASAATQNSHYLRKNQKPTQKIAQKQPGPKTQTKQTQTKQTQTKVESQIAQTPTIPKFAPFQAKYAINFGGKPSKGGKLALKDEFGEIQSNGFLSLATQAKANPILLSCINTGYQNISNSPDVKSLADNKILPKTSEYKKGLNGSAWMTQVGNHLIGIGPVAVLNNAKPAKNLKLFIYKNYMSGTKQNPNQILTAKINTQQGSNGLLYRAYVNEKNSVIKCMDIVFNNNSPANAKGYMYYINNRGQLLENEFKLEPIKN